MLDMSGQHGIKVSCVGTHNCKSQEVGKVLNNWKLQVSCTNNHTTRGTGSR